MREEAKRERTIGHTDDHYGELEALSDALAVDLVGKIGKTNVAHQFLADDGSNTGRAGRKRGA
jgi:hypothetical protein